MSNQYHFENNHIVLDTMPKSFKKITATRFAAVMGLNRWTTPFQIWCALTRTWEQPFEDNIYTKAGKIIEPKIREDYLRNKLFWDVDNPDDVIGDGTAGSAFKKTWGDFYHSTKVLGGMWDGLGHDDETGEDYILEIKTTKRAEDWLDGVPEYYKLQAALYTYLSGLDRFYVTGTFLENSDYDHPENFVANSQNTKIYLFSLGEEYPHFKRDYVDKVLAFWNQYVVSGMSPDFDEKKDTEALKALQTVEVTDDDLNTLLEEYDANQMELNSKMVEVQPLIDRQKKLKVAIKGLAVDNFKADSKYESFSSKHFDFNVTKTTRQTVDGKKLKDAGLFDQYSKETESYTLREKVKSED
ncbi:YqaJ viral recombinase family protein [Bombilactobacillus folatiphilus]|uniref:YqaJ viral recombinase family protein n=1 Tax=Bombilactobacillus folatiphilus TaxID=2923362 RepID=A0ABY4PAB0_9LACO|nr:YqaJ viral recombinase family protein [Bombilactobacillus folatiphilus]UQS82586.1 YqaJ viral recombinase family protein [Bombilactobacillus folatiphilus]